MYIIWNKKYHNFCILVLSAKFFFLYIVNSNLWNVCVEKKSIPERSRLSTNSRNTSINYLPRSTIKNINKRNPKGETPLHIACIKVYYISLTYIYIYIYNLKIAL